MRMLRLVAALGLCACGPTVKAYRMRPNVYDVAIEGSGRNAGRIALMDALHATARKLCRGRPYDLYPTGADRWASAVPINGQLFFVGHGSMSARVECVDEDRLAGDR